MAPGGGSVSATIPSHPTPSVLKSRERGSGNDIWDRCQAAMLVLKGGPRCGGGASPMDASCCLPSLQDAGPSAPKSTSREEAWAGPGAVALAGPRAGTPRAARGTVGGHWFGTGARHTRLIGTMVLPQLPLQVPTSQSHSHGRRHVASHWYVLGGRIQLGHCSGQWGTLPAIHIYSSSSGKPAACGPTPNLGRVFHGIGREFLKYSKLSKQVSETPQN